MRLRVVGIDSSIEMLSLAGRLVPAASLAMADMTEVEFTAGSFAAIVAWDLFHVDRRHHRGMYSNFARRLRPGGRVLFTSGGTGDEGFTSSMFGEEFFYRSHPPDEVRACLREAGLSVLTQEPDEPFDKGHVSFLVVKWQDTSLRASITVDLPALFLPTMIVLRLSGITWSLKQRKLMRRNSVSIYAPCALLVAGTIATDQGLRRRSW